MKRTYVLDARDRVIGIAGDWDVFAMENGGADSVAGKVLGRRLWEFVADQGTVSYLATIFHACRQTAMPFATTYRCDTPDEVMPFRMTVTPVEGGVLDIGHQFLSSHPMERPDNIAALRERLDLVRCSMCCRYRLDEVWVDAFLMPDCTFTPESHTMCPDCRAAAGKKLADMGAAHVERGRFAAAR